ncbi:hypothetical protein S83_047603, partial [Arachis hypogaea]
ANKSGNNWLPLPWAIVALLILGFNEFMTLLSPKPYGCNMRSRVDSYPSIKLLPTIMNLMRKLAEEGVPQTNNPRPPYPSTSNQTAGSTVSSTASSKVLWLVGGA